MYAHVHAVFVWDVDANRWVNGRFGRGENSTLRPTAADRAGPAPQSDGHGAVSDWVKGSLGHYLDDTDGAGASPISRMREAVLEMVDCLVQVGNSGYRGRLLVDWRCKCSRKGS